jgi:hypothetical protein
MTSPSPTIELHVPSASTMKTAQKLPSFQSQHDHSVSSTNQLAPPIVVFHQPDTGKPVSIINKSVDNSKSLWNLDEINRFTRDIFKLNSGNTSDDKSSVLVVVFFFKVIMVNRTFIVIEFDWIGKVYFDIYSLLLFMIAKIKITM